MAKAQVSFHALVDGRATAFVAGDEIPDDLLPTLGEHITGTPTDAVAPEREAGAAAPAGGEPQLGGGLTPEQVAEAAKAAEVERIVALELPAFLDALDALEDEELRAAVLAVRQPEVTAAAEPTPEVEPAAPEAEATVAGAKAPKAAKA